MRRSEGKRQLGKPRRVDGRIILKLIFKRCDAVWSGFIWLKIGTSGGICQCCNKSCVQKKFWEFLD